MFGLQFIVIALTSIALDAVFADRFFLPHPVVVIGKLISVSEHALRRVFPKTPGGERAAGAVMGITLPIVVLAVTCGVIYAAWLVHPALAFALQLLWGWQALAMRGLAKESANVLDKLEHGTIEDARGAVARIVGRDTGELTEQGVTRAAVETVAENFSDGVIAPLFYLLLGGAPLALCYKSINTMDSMVGYKNERYLHFGCVPAHLDDIVNWLPARLSALFLTLAAGFTGNDMGRAWRVFRRDRFNHASPNSAQTEAVMAGALGVELAGPASYFGVVHEKPTIGDCVRAIEPADIRRANTMMYVGCVVGFVILAAARFGIYVLTGGV